LLTDDHNPLILDGNPDWSITIRIDYIKKETSILQPTVIQQIRKNN
jgi:hypothetical protein